MISGTNLVSGAKSEYTYYGLLARVKKTSGTAVSAYMPNYFDSVKRGLNGYAYCDNDPANQTDPTGEVANVVIGGIAGAVIGGAFGFAGSALSQMAEGHGFNARKAWGAAANGAIVGAARGALIGSGAGIPLAFGVDFAAGMAGSLAEQKISGARIAPVRAAVDGAFNAAGGRLYGTSPLKNVKNAFMRGALEGAVKGGAYNIADVLDNRLRNAYNARKRQKLRTTRKRNTWKKKNKNPWNSRNPRPTGSRSPQSHCGKPKPLKGMRNPKRRSSRNRIYRTHIARPNDRFRFRSFVRDVVAGAVMGGLSSAAFYGAGKAVEALINSMRGVSEKNVLMLQLGDNDPSIEETIKILGSSTNEEFRVVGHGNEEGIEFRGHILGAKEVAHLIRHSPQYVGGKQRIRLYACSTGKKPDGFAQQLADILGVEVEAPNMLVYPTKDGEFMVGVLKGIEFTEGEWITFRPKFIK